MRELTSRDVYTRIDIRVGGNCLVRRVATREVIGPVSVMLWLVTSAASTASTTRASEYAPPPAHPNGCYSDEALKARAEGTTRIRVLVTEDGNVEEVYVVNSSGNNALDDAAVTCAKRFHYKPATLHGKPVAAWTEADVVFRLGGRPTQSIPAATKPEPAEAQPSAK